MALNSLIKEEIPKIIKELIDEGIGSIKSTDVRLKLEKKLEVEYILNNIV